MADEKELAKLTEALNELGYVAVPKKRFSLMVELYIEVQKFVAKESSFKKLKGLVRLIKE